MKVFNLTKHAMTPQQLAEGGIDVPAAQRASDLQDFTSMPTSNELKSRAFKLMDLAIDAGGDAGDGVMLAGEVYFIPYLVSAAKTTGFKPVFSFTQQVSKETKNKDGLVELSYVFIHEGWISI